MSAANNSDFSVNMAVQKRVNLKLVVSEQWQGVFCFLPEDVKQRARELIQDGWRIEIVKQSRGRCYYQSKLITVPEWALRDSREGFKTYYLCHEMAHAFHYQSPGFDHNADPHGSQFMDWLIRICPKQYLHYELGYKPRYAAAAGITQPKIKLGF